MKKYFFLLSTLILLFVSCDIKEEGVSDSLIIEIDNPYGTQLITNYNIPFTAKTSTGNDLTSTAVFYINGQAQSGNEIRFDQTGSFEITASATLDGQNINSAPYTVNVINPRHSTKVLVEDYTATWCTNCPRVAYHLEEAVSQSDHVIPVAIHHSRYTGDDPFGFNEVTTLKSDFNITGLPSPIVNRSLGFVWDENYGTLQTEMGKSQPLGLAISSNVSGSTLNIDASVRFDMDLSKKNLNLVLYLTENGLHADQANGTSFYGGQDPIPNFEQKHCLRSALVGIYGIAIPPGETVANAVYHYQYSGNIPSEVNDINNCDIEAFIIAGDDNNAKLINIQKAAVGETKDFD